MSQKGARRRSIAVVLAAFLAAIFFAALGAAQPGAAPHFKSGDLDPSFGLGGAATQRVGQYGGASAVAVQRDGKIVVVGATGHENLGFVVLRYTPDGSLDPTFGGDGVVTTPIGVYSGPTALALQSDGKIVVGGSSGWSEGERFTVARYERDGSLDASFGEGGVVATSLRYYFEGANALALQPDGKIVLAGSVAAGAEPTFSDFALVRYLPDGSLDPSFGRGGFVTTSFPRPFPSNEFTKALLLQPDGELVVVGYSSPTCHECPIVEALVRYDVNGSPDPSFGRGGFVFGPPDSLTGAGALQTDGKIVTAGVKSVQGKNTVVLTRYKPDGSLDPDFGRGGVAPRKGPEEGGVGGRALALQPDGKIVIAGDGWVENHEVFAVARSKANGSPDPSFGTNGISTTFAHRLYEARALALQPDGKIVAVGQAENGDGSLFAAARFLGGSNLRLHVKRRGNGRGRVSSSPAGISCGKGCTAWFARGSSVKLGARPWHGSVVSWGGACSGRKRFCHVDMRANRSVMVRFWRCVVPDVTGKSVRKARRAIRRAHCALGTVGRVFSSGVARGRVLRQKPEAGAKRPARARVSLVVSKGKRR